MKLGGWHRLWIFLSVIYLLFVIVFGINEFPSKPEDTSHKNEFYQKLSTESREIISEKDFYRADSSNKGDSVDKTDEFSFWQDAYDRSTQNDELEKLVQKLLDVKVPEEEIGAFIKEYKDILNQNASEKKVSFVINTFLIWIVPCLSLYALGWTIRWVFRGFKAK